MVSKIQKIIDRGIDFLAKGQGKDGSFFCLVSTKFDDYKNANVVPAIVPTNIVLSSLAHISESDKADRIKEKTAKFLLGEKSKYWSFNYWFRKSDWYKKEPYPDDTDDTFCALAALYEYDPKLFDGAVMARIVTMLTSCEEKEGGPYDMWLVPPYARDKWRDIDLVCNSNIAYFLSLQDIHLPKLDTFIDTSIRKRDYEFPYNKIYPGIYFISRFYRGGLKKEMIKLILSKQEADGKWENPLRTALAISSLVNFEGFKRKLQLEKGVDYLIKTQGPNGGWEPYSFYFQMRTKKKTLFAGSPFITTALCLEAINKYSKISNYSKQIPSTKSPKIESKIHDAVLEKYRQRFFWFSEDFQEKAITEALKITKKNKDIVLLPFYFRNALGAISKKVSDDLIVQLGVANLFGWIAYTIYDDFLDEEGDPKELPLANVCLRESAEIFGTVLPLKFGFTPLETARARSASLFLTGFAVFSKKIFDTIDGANMWEVSNCWDVSAIPNYGDYSQLANKSLGHALGPIAILFALGYKAHSAEVRNTMRFFRNYIIARQLNDDAHDWEDDLKKGQVNAVAAILLKDVKGNMHDTPKLREIFWHKTIVGVCKDILRHVELAKKDLKKLSIMKEPDHSSSPSTRLGHYGARIFMGMLAAIEQSAEEALKEREETMKFLKTYSFRNKLK